MIDDDRSRVNTDVAVVPAYGTPEAAIIQPERHAPLSLYAIHRWLPRLGGQRLALVLVLRALAFDAATAADGTRRVTVSREQLAQATGVANAGTIGEWLRSEPIVGGGGWRRIARTCPEAEALSRFIPRLRYAYSGRVRTGIVVCVRMDDPLAPEDEPLAERIRIGQQTASATQLGFAALPGAAVDLQPLPGEERQTGSPAKAGIPPSVAPVKAAIPLSQAALKTALPSSALPDRAWPLPSTGAPAGDAAPRQGTSEPLPLSFQVAKAAAPSSPTPAKSPAPPSSCDCSRSYRPEMLPGAVKAANSAINVNANEEHVISDVTWDDASRDGLVGSDAVKALSAALARVRPGLKSRAEVRQELEPLVGITVERLGDAGSAAFFAKAYEGLYSAGRLDLAVAALREASSEKAERPGALFTATLKRLCAREGVRLGLKGERVSPEVEGSSAVAGQGGGRERSPSEKVQPWRSGGESDEEGEETGAIDAAGCRLWAEARAELEASMARSTYDMWLRNSTLVDVRWGENVTFILGFPHRTAMEWVSHRLCATVERVLTSVVGRPVSIECVVPERAAVVEAGAWR